MWKLSCLWVKPRFVLFLRVMNPSRFMINGIVLYGVSLFRFYSGSKSVQYENLGVYEKATSDLLSS